MDVFWDDIDGFLKLRIVGRMDLESYPELKRTITRLLEQDHKQVLINLRDVILISSSGVGALVNLGRDLEKEGGRMVLVELSAVCKQVIEFLRLSDVLSIFPDDAAGVAFLRIQAE